MSGSTLTVSVDGHSDSVNLSSLTPLSGTINMYVGSSYSTSNAPVVQYTISSSTSPSTKYAVSPSSVTHTLSSGNVSILCNSCSTSAVSETGYFRRVTIPSSTLKNALIDSYSLQGSGTIKLSGMINAVVSNTGDILHTSSTNGLITITIEVDSGQISSVTSGTMYKYNNSSVSSSTSWSTKLILHVQSISVS